MEGAELTNKSDHLLLGRIFKNQESSYLREKRHKKDKGFVMVYKRLTHCLFVCLVGWLVPCLLASCIGNKVLPCCPVKLQILTPPAIAC